MKLIQRDKRFIKMFGSNYEQQFTFIISTNIGNKKVRTVIIGDLKCS